jgi:hypothetical protein
MRSTRGMTTRRGKASDDADRVWSVMNISDQLAWFDEIVSSSVTVSQFDSAITSMQIDNDTLMALAAYEFNSEPVPDSRSLKYKCLHCGNSVYRASFRSHIWPLSGNNRCEYWKSGPSDRLCELNATRLRLTCVHC